MSSTSPAQTRAAEDPSAYLGLCVERFRMLCRLRLAERDGDANQIVAAREALKAADDLGPRHPALEELATRFCLNRLETEIVILALCVFLDPGFKTELARVHGPEKRLHLYVERAVVLLGGTIAERVEVRRALATEGGLMTAGILRLKDTIYSKDPALFEVKLSPSAINAVMGQPLSESSTRGIALLEMPQVPLARVVLPEWKEEVVRLVTNFREYQIRLKDWGVADALHYGRGLVILFSGPPGTGKTMLAHALAAHAGRPLMTINTGRLIENASAAETLFEDLFFEAQFHGAIPFFDECELLFERHTLHFYDHLHALEHFDGVILLATNEDMRLDEALERRVTYHARFRLPDIAHREEIWRYHLPPGVPVEPDLNLTGLAEQFELSGGQIKNAVLLAVNKSLAGRGEEAILREVHLSEASSAQLRARLDDFGDELRPDLCLDDLILSDELAGQLGEVLRACRYHRTFLHKWGMARRIATGRGVVALFDGPPGTGKTLACEVLAAELERPIQRIQLAQVISKWVGETEKHIAKIFKEARSSSTILLFDEADALFGERVSVNTAQDRFANMETNQLLSEIERFDGIVFLTTNLEANLDNAFKRRIQYRITFKDPDLRERRRIWERLCPDWVPREEAIDFAALAKAFDLPGGHIKNAVMRACYIALGEGRGLLLRDLVAAGTAESRLAGRLFRGDSLSPASR